jgi:hypothetical protein
MRWWFYNHHLEGGGFFSVFLGGTPHQIVLKGMKEQLQANLFTKYLAGLCSSEEEAFLKEWLKSNPANQLFLGFVQQNIPQSLRFSK